MVLYFYKRWANRQISVKLPCLPTRLGITRVGYPKRLWLVRFAHKSPTYFFLSRGWPNQIIQCLTFRATRDETSPGPTMEHLTLWVLHGAHGCLLPALLHLCIGTASGASQSDIAW